MKRIAGLLTACILMLPLASAPAQTLFQETFSGTMNAAWNIVRQDASFYSMTSAGLSLRCNSGDLYQGANNAQNLFLITNPAPGDFTVTLKLRWIVPPAAPYAQIDLLAYDDDNHHMRPQYVCTSSGPGLANASEVGGSYASSTTSPVDFGTNRFWLQMQKAGLTYSIWYSTNGTDYVSASTAYSYPNAHPARLGFVAMCDPGSSAQVIIESFTVQAGTPNTSAAGTRFFVPVSLAPVANAVNDRLAGCPTGSQVLGGVPFTLLPSSGNNAWDAVVGTTVGQPSTNIMELRVNLPSVTAVDLLLNLSWGYGGQSATITFMCSDGFSYTKQLVSGTDMRDWLEGAYVNGISSPDTIQVYSAPAAHLSNRTGRIDKQHIELPAEFATRRLTRVVLKDAGVTGNDDVTYSQSIHAQRIFLYGLTFTAAPGLIAWWPFDGNFTELVAGLSGTASGSPGFVAEAPLGQAARFDGNTQWYQVDSPGIVAGNAEATVAAWIRPRGPQGGSYSAGYIWFESTASTAQGLNNYTRLAWAIDQQGYGRFFGRDSENGFVYGTNSLAPLPVGVWTHLAGTWKAGEGLRLYVNGALNNQLSAPAMGALTASVANWVLIAATKPAAGTETFNGDLDELMIFNRALSGDQIASIYLTQGGRPRLDVHAQSDRILLSWPSLYTGFILETSPQVAGGLWQAVTNSPMSEGGLCTVLLPPTEAQRWFRLRSGY